jgi:tyrosine-specific transport protein
MRVFGGVMLVAGTTIGAGMLALPTVTAFAGFYPSLLLFAATWLLMLATALFFLDVNLSMREEGNLISMSGRMLGAPGRIVCWLFYLLLLYALNAAYMAGSAPLFATGVAATTGYSLPSWLAPLSLPLVFGIFIYLGTHGVDHINRWFMIGLAASYVSLIFFVPSHVETSRLERADLPAALVAVPVVFTSFGYHIIIPSLSSYLKRNRTQLRCVLVVGSALPFAVYVAWQLLVMGTVPQEDLEAAYRGGLAATEALSRVLSDPWIALSAQFFSFFAIVTSFLGVALALVDFLVDGLHMQKKAGGRLVACLLAFVPPLLFVFSFQRGFYLALQHAGAFVAVLLGILPAAMAWKLRAYRAPWRRALLIAVITLSLSVVVLDFLQQGGIFNRLIAP